MREQDESRELGGGGAEGGGDDDGDLDRLSLAGVFRRAARNDGSRTGNT